MKLCLRILFLCVLAVSLPLHAAFGIASAQRAAFGHDAYAQAGSESHRSSLPAAAAGMVDHCHGAAGAVAGDVGHERSAPGHTHAGGDGHQDDAAGSASHCGNCSACCTSVAIVGFATAFHAPPGYGVRIDSAERRLVGLPIPPLDRPPLVL